MTVVAASTRCTRTRAPPQARRTLAPCLQGPHVRLQLRNCRLCSNNASGMWLLGGAAASLAHCALRFNCCNGAACWDSGGSLTLRCCTLDYNAMNGVRVLHGARGALQGCDIAVTGDSGVEAGSAAAVDVRDCRILGAMHLCYPIAACLAGAVSDGAPCLVQPLSLTSYNTC